MIGRRGSVGGVETWSRWRTETPVEDAAIRRERGATALIDGSIGKDSRVGTGIEHRSARNFCRLEGAIRTEVVSKSITNPM